MNFSSASAPTQTECPVSGMPVLTHPEWCMGKSEDPYQAQYSLIGDRIVHSHPKGFANSDITRKSLQLSRKVGQHLLEKHPSYIQIENFTELKGFTLNARLTFIRYLQKHPPLHALIFYGVPAITALSIKIAAKLYLARYPVKVAASYEEAVNVALSLLNTPTATRSPSVEKTEDNMTDQRKRSESGKQKHSTKSLSIKTDPSWQLDIDGYHVQYEIINGHILHSTATGYFGGNQLEPVLKMQARIFEKLDDGPYGRHIVSDLSGITGTSYQTRMRYTRMQNDFYHKYGFDTFQFYGASKLLRAAIFLGRPFAAFKVDVYDTLGHCLNRIYERNVSTQEEAPGGKTIEDYNADLLIYLGLLNVDVDEKPKQRPQFAADHPFRDVFDTIDLIYADLNEITRQRQKEQSQRIELERQLATAQKMEALGTLAGGIAHDFNNILAGILGYCHLAQKNIDSPDIATQKIDQVITGAKRAADLVKQILIFSRHMEAQKAAIPLKEIVEEAVRLIRSSLPATIAVKENLLSARAVYADPARIHQIVMNLCTNAYQAMSTTGGKLTVRLEDRRLSDTDAASLALKPGEYLKLTVTDTGPGIDAQYTERIFDPYFTTKDTGKGTGLGLSLVYAIVTEYKGHIQVESAPGKGCTFTVLLPVTDRPQERMDTLARTPLPAGGEERIMIIDDDPSILDSTRELLLDSGFQVTAFADPVQAFDAFLDAPLAFDLIVTDQTMPGMTGDVLAGKILELKPDMPIILCTGFNENITESGALGIGIRRFLQKPIVDESLAVIIRETLDRDR